jgi:predicted RNA-binding Zn-ribbon protein involved in translation (DUF1610 family)
MIAWDELSAADASALVWAVASIAAAGPAAFAAILWVQAWRGSPRFSPPRCAACAIELFPTERDALAERCPECGHATTQRGASTVRYAVRRWHWWRAIGTFAAGALAFATAFLSAAAAGVGANFLIRESAATAQVEAIASTLQRHRSHRAVMDALRFASDGAPDDPATREELLLPLRALLDDAIPADRGLSLLIDRHDNEEARSLVVDALGSLRAAEGIDERTLLAVLARTAGPPAVRMVAVPGGVGEVEIIFHLPDAALEPVIDAIDFNGAALPSAMIGPVERRRVVRDGGGDRQASAEPSSVTAGSQGVWSARVRLGDAGQRAIDSPSLRLRWSLRWQVRAAALGDASATGATASVSFEVTLAGAGASVADDGGVRDSSESIASFSASSLPHSPFLARGLLPRVHAHAVGRMTAVRVHMRASLLPGWSLSGRWELRVGEERVPLAGSMTEDGFLIHGAGLLALPIESMPGGATLVYQPVGSVDADATEGLLPWPKSVTIEAIRW